MEQAPIERSDLVFVDGPVVEPARLRKDCLLIDDAVKRTFRNAAIAALQPLRDPTDDPRRLPTACSTTLPGRLG